MKFFARDEKMESLQNQLGSAQARVAALETEKTYLLARVKELEEKNGALTERVIDEAHRYVDRTMRDIGRRPVYGILSGPENVKEAQPAADLQLVDSAGRRATREAEFLKKHDVRSAVFANLGMEVPNGAHGVDGEPSSRAAGSPTEGGPRGGARSGQDAGRQGIAV